MLLVFNLFSSIFMLPLIINFISNSLKHVKNYRGKIICNFGGIFFSLNILCMCTISYMYLTLFPEGHGYKNEILIILLGVLSASLSGCIDDDSDEEPKGITGHVKSLFKGELTSGTIKAFIGALSSLIISFSKGFMGLYTFLDFLILCLMQNIINLMDLRPLRAIKSYIILSLIISIFANLNFLYTGMNSGIIISLIFYSFYEAKEICMMGDTGSNTLGMFLGLMSLNLKSISYKIVMLLFLIFVHVYSEHASISDFIERNSLLKKLDMIGRRKK